MIFSHVLYQLSYPGIAAAAVVIPASDWKRAYDEAARSWQARITWPLFLFGQFRFSLGAGQGIAVVKPFQQIAVAAGAGAKWGMLGAAGFSADRAGAAIRTD
jgi:hypothetical protein